MDVLQGRKGAGAQLPIQGLACLFLGVLPTDYLGPKATPKEAVVEQGQAWQTVLCPEVGPGHQGRAWVSHLRAVQSGLGPLTPGPGPLCRRSWGMLRLDTELSSHNSYCDYG